MAGIETGSVSSKKKGRLYDRQGPSLIIMITGARMTSSFHSEHRQIPHLRQLTPDPWVQINPKAAEPLNISDGDWV